MVRVARFLVDFSQRWQGIRQGRRTRALLCTFMLELMDKVSLSGSKIAGCCTGKLLRLLSKKTLHSGIELISEFPKE